MGSCSVVDEPEQDQELRPRAETLVHGVRMQGGVFAEALVEAAERVVAEERVVLRQHAALLRVEEEDETEDDSEEPSVDIVSVAVLGERLPKQLGAGGIVGGLEPPDELVEGVHHLLGEALAHLVLVLATVLEEGGEPLRARQREQALLGEEEAKGGAEGAPGGEAHVRDAEVHPAGALAPRRGDEAKRDAVEGQARGNPSASEQSLGAAVERGFEARLGAPGYRRVEVLPRVEHLHEKLPWSPAITRVALADGEVGEKGLAVVRKGKLQLGRNGSLLRARIPTRREAPAQGGGGEFPEVGDAGLGTAGGVKLALLDATGETVLPFHVLPVQDGSRLRERRGGDHEAVRLDETEPFEVGAGVGVGGGHVAVAGLSVLRRAAEVLHSEQLPVRWPKVLAVSGGKDPPPRGGNDVPVPEVVHQQVVVRE